MTDAENRELAERLGILPDRRALYCQHCEGYCKSKTRYCKPPILIYPDFSDPRVVLREIRKREDWIEFISSLCKGKTLVYQTYSGTFIMIDYILDTTGLLAKAALEWLREARDER